MIEVYRALPTVNQRTGVEIFDATESERTGTATSGADQFAGFACGTAGSGP